MALIPGCVSWEPGGFIHLAPIAALRAVAAPCESVGSDLVEGERSRAVGAAS